MKNKLLLSTALIGSIAFAAPLMAETKITGSIDMSYTGSSVDANAGADSADGLGSETQLNISNSGDLNVGGLKYKAGFSIESDTTADAFENAYIDISNSSGTTFTVGSDHFPSLDGTVTPTVSIAADTATGGVGGTGANNETITGLLYFNGSRIDAVESQGLGIMQKMGNAGTVGIYYAPTLANFGSTTGNDTIPANTANSATNIQFKGSLGVDGLTVLVGQEKSDGATTNVSDRKGTNYGISYNFGQVAVGASRVKNELSTGNKIESDEVGVTFAINDNFTVGAMYVESDNSTAATAEEEITMLSAGYNLGGLVTSVTYAQVDNIAGGTTDTEFFNVRIGAKF